MLDEFILLKGDCCPGRYKKQGFEERSEEVER